MNQEQDSALRFSNFAVGYPTREGIRWIVDGVNLTVPTGQLVLLVGPSGGGKSSLLSTILGSDDPYAPRIQQRGEVAVLGTTLAGPLPGSLRGRVGAVFQDGALIDELSPQANVALAVREAGKPKTAVQEVLAQVNLTHLPTRVAALSGGEKRRLSLARALVQSPELLVLDEPTAGLDPPTAQQMAQLIRDVHDQHGAAFPEQPRTTLVVTHDLEAFQSVADSGLILDPKRGALEPIELTAMPARLEKLRSSSQRSSAPPATEPQPWTTRLVRTCGSCLLSLAAVVTLLTQAIRHLVPYHLGMFARSLAEILVAPALYYAIAAAAGGGLVTAFVLRNNPLNEAFRREILMGSGTVLLGAFLPLLIGVLFAARTAAGSAARIGAMRQARVFEALPLLGVSPVAFLLTPLLLSSIVAALVLTALGIVCGLFASLTVTQAFTDLSHFAWASTTTAWITGSDLQWVMAKALATALITALVAFALGSRPKHSAQDVARGTNGAIVWSTLLVLVSHAAMTLSQYGD